MSGSPVPQVVGGVLYVQISPDGGLCESDCAVALAKRMGSYKNRVWCDMVASLARLVESIDSAGGEREGRGGGERDRQTDRQTETESARARARERERGEKI